MSNLDPTKPVLTLDEMIRNGPLRIAVAAFLEEVQRPDQLDQTSAITNGMRRAIIAAARASHDRIDDQLCVCGHKHEDHYTYILNGHEQSRCKSCDPMAGLPAGNYEMVSDSYVAAMNKAADHEFEPMEAPDAR